MSEPKRQLLYEDRLEFERLVPELGSTLHKRFASGWRVLRQEYALDKTLVFGAAERAVKILGRLDRLEQAREGLAIVDVKTTQKTTLKTRAKAWEHYPQLPLYAWMLGQACQSLAYLCIKGDVAEYVPVPDEKSAAAAAVTPEDMASSVVALLSEALIHFFEDGQYFKPLPGKECEFCQFSGVCRNQWVNQHEGMAV
jgi:RecB family exonuclease